LLLTWVVKRAVRITRLDLTELQCWF